MSRIALAAFAALVIATVAAFFVTQHLKVTTPLIAGFPHPTPEYIAPAGHGCGGAHRVTRMSFYLLHRADQVAVYVVDPSGAIVRTLSSGRHMSRRVRVSFNWDGHTDTGAIAPDGSYFYRIALLTQGRTIELSEPVVVQDTPPRPVVQRVVPSALSPGGAQVLIHVSGNEGRGGVVFLYRLARGGYPRLVKTFRSAFTNGIARWDARIRQRPAAAGVYLVGLRVADQACNAGLFPPSFPPRPGTVSQAQITVS